MVEGDDGSGAPADKFRDAMTELRQVIDFIPNGAVARFRAQVPALLDRIVDQIQQDVDRYAGPDTGRRHRLIAMAASAAINHFLDMVEHGPKPAPRVDDLFRRMGYGEAVDGRDLSAMQAAFRIATRDAWDDLRTFAAELQLSAAVLGSLADALFEFMDHLAEQTAIGFETGAESLDRDVDAARERLLTALLEGRPHHEIRSHAANAVWPLPARFTVLAVADPDRPIDAAALDTHALVARDTAPLVVLCDQSNATAVVDQVRTTYPDARIAVSWPVESSEVPDARRWADRTLLLARNAVIADEPVIDCREHRTQIWLHAEPALRQRMCQELLRPLLAETPNSREILSQTLLTWLETRDSAPAIAAQLGVHAQTVRYRWKRINELFGDDLHDPEFMVQITMLLKASVPLWQAGDQSDFERFQAEESA